MQSRASKWIFACAFVVAVGCSADVADEDPMDAIERSSEALSMPSGAAYLPFSSSAAPSGAIALTFDDGPDDTWTEKVLDVLAQKHVTATFFVNTANWCTLAYDAHCRDVLRRIHDEGHAIGNHTAHHADLGDPDTDVENELVLVERAVRKYVPSASMLTLVRAPYGNPYESGPQWRLDEVAPIVARHGVHVGWSIDSLDSEGCGSASCVKHAVFSSLDRGRRGVVLMHSTFRWTAAALPDVIDEVRARGMRFVSVETLVRRRYGVSSYTLTRRAQGK